MRSQWYAPAQAVADDHCATRARRGAVGALRPRRRRRSRRARTSIREGRRPGSSTTTCTAAGRRCRSSRRAPPPSSSRSRTPSASSRTPSSLVGTMGPLPTKQDREDLTVRLQAVRTAVDAAHQGDARRRGVEALGERPGAGRALHQDGSARRRRRGRARRRPPHEMRTLQERWKAVAAAPRSQAETLWTRFKAAQDQVYEKCKDFFAQQAAERQENLKKKEALVRARRGAGRFDRLGAHGRRHQAAAGRVEDDRPGHARPREVGVGALPRRVRQASSRAARRT